MQEGTRSASVGLSRLAARRATTTPASSRCAQAEHSKGVYFTDRGIEELQARRGDDEVTLAWLADQLRTFVDLHPEFEAPVERLATWLARLDEEGE